MKALKQILLLITIISASAIVIIIALTKNAPVETNRYIDDDANYEEVIFSNTSEITDVSINLISKGINISYNENIAYTMNCYVSSDVKITSEIIDGQLLITETKNKKDGFVVIDNTSSTVKTIELRLPKGYQGTLNVVCDSEKIRLNDLNLDAITITNKVGNVILRKVTIAKDLTIKTTLGSITCTDMKVNNITLETKTGEVQLHAVAGNDLDVTSNSGSFTIFNSFLAKIILKSNSGTIIVNESQIDYVDISTKSGDVDMQLLKEVGEYQLFLVAEHGNVYYQNERLIIEELPPKEESNLIVYTKVGNIDIVVEVPLEEE